MWREGDGVAEIGPCEVAGCVAVEVEHAEAYRPDPQRERERRLDPCAERGRRESPATGDGAAPGRARGPGRRPVGVDARALAEAELQLVHGSGRVRHGDSAPVLPVADDRDAGAAHRQQLDAQRQDDRGPAHRQRQRGHPRLEPAGPGPPRHAAVRAGRPGLASSITSPTPTSALEGRLCCFKPRRGRDRAPSTLRGRVTAPDGAARLRCLPRREQVTSRDVVERRGEGVPPHHRSRRELRARQAWYGACSSAAVSSERGRQGAPALVRGGQSPSDVGGDHRRLHLHDVPSPNHPAVTGVSGDGTRHRDHCRRQPVTSKPDVGYTASGAP